MENRDPEEIKNSESDFGKVVEELHQEQKIPTLRTYQGDVAKFIKEKNESTISIALKERTRKKEEDKLIPTENPNKQRFGINFMALFLSIFLIVAGIFSSLYAFQFLFTEKESEKIINVEIIPYNNTITISAVTAENLGIEISKIEKTNGISIIKISDKEGLSIDTSIKLFDFINIPKTKSIRRSLTKDFVVGSIFKGQDRGNFLILKVDDFGRSFSSMLEWEKDMAEELNLITYKEQQSTSTDFIWKDLIVKNKDVRSYTNNKRETKIAYTFLDKNTVLITDNMRTIEDISLAYASSKVVR